MWNWEAIDPGRSGSSGDLAKLFKNESVAQPGVLAEGAPSPDATLLAREVIQNSWDAARELQHHETAVGREAPDFEIVFHFRELVHDAKHAFTRALGLDELAERAAHQNRTDLGLAQDDCLQHLGSDRPLRVLDIHESGTTGMYGAWKNVRSKLYLALVSLGFTVKEEGAGGSYGYGKSGLIRGSSTRTVFAYTCFRPEPDDPGVTRRALGMTYWGLHENAGTSYNGFARFGRRDPVDGAVRPFENGEADERARELGLPLRSREHVTQLGSSFLLVDPTVEPAELVTAISRSWWPAILDGKFHVSVVDVDGVVHHPRPKRDETLRTFIRSYELATVAQDNTKPDERAHRFNALALAPGDKRQLGDLGLVSDATAWSWPRASDDVEEPLEHRSLVALVRGPRMVVEYHDCGAARPYVRGTFVAHRDVDDLLRQTEPKAHDAWQTKSHGEGVDPAATKVADTIQKRIRQRVDEFRRALKPPTPDRRDIRLPVLEDLFRDLVKPPGHAVPEVPHEKREVAIRIVQQDLRPADIDKVTYFAAAQFQLSEHVDTEEAPAEVELRFVFVEDGRLGTEPVPAAVTAPPGWVAEKEKPWRFHGTLGRQPTRFSILTDPYNAEWTGRLIASGDLVRADQAVAP